MSFFLTHPPSLSANPLSRLSARSDHFVSSALTGTQPFGLHSRPPMYTLGPSLHFFRSCFPQVPSASQLPVPCASRPARPFALPLLPSSGLVSSAFCYAPSCTLRTVSPLRISAFHSIPFGTSSDDLCFPSASRLRYSPHTLSCAPCSGSLLRPTLFPRSRASPGSSARSPLALGSLSGLVSSAVSSTVSRFALLLPLRSRSASASLLFPFRSLSVPSVLSCSASASLQLSPLFCAVPLRPASPFTSRRSFSRQPFGCRQAPLTSRPSSLRSPLCFRSLLALPRLSRAPSDDLLSSGSHLPTHRCLLHSLSLCATCRKPLSFLVHLAVSQTA